jgi:hypothetical protein
MQKKLFGVVLTSTFLLVGCYDDENKIQKGVNDPIGTPSSSGEIRLQDNGKVTKYDGNKIQKGVDSMGTSSSSGEIRLQDNGKVTEYAITSPSPGTDIDIKKGPFTVTCKIENFTQDKADGKFFWISIEDVKQAKHWPKFPVEDEQCPPISIQEGGNNSGDKREINVLLLRINLETNQEFYQWMEKGHKTGYYPGFPLNQSDIVASVSIFIP